MRTPHEGWLADSILYIETIWLATSMYGLKRLTNHLHFFSLHVLFANKRFTFHVTCHWVLLAMTAARHLYLMTWEHWFKTCTFYAPCFVTFCLHCMSGWMTLNINRLTLKVLVAAVWDYKHLLTPHCTSLKANGVYTHSVNNLKWNAYLTAYTSLTGLSLFPTFGETL